VAAIATRPVEFEQGFYYTSVSGKPDSQVRCGLRSICGNDLLCGKTGL